MFKIKICGVRLKQDIDAVGRAGADAIGLNFFPKSIRYVDPSYDATRQLSAHAQAAGILRVGVFVNATADSIASIASAIELNAVQLHGDETTEFAAGLVDSGLTVIRAIKLPLTDLTADLIHDRCGRWSDLGCHLLLDAAAGAAHGGSGKCLDWQVVGQWANSQTSTSWTLAGGLDPENVGQAIEASRARSVDTASGVEEPRGTKSVARIESFVKSCRQGFSQNES